mgnify:CR=1 FL=1
MKFIKKPSLLQNVDVPCGRLSHRHGGVTGPIGGRGVDTEGQVLSVILIQSLCIGDRNEAYGAASGRTYRVAGLQFHLLGGIQHNETEGLAGVGPGGIEIGTALKGNEFYAPLQSVYENGNGLLFDYGMALDLYYFNQIWSVRKKLFKGNDLDEITKAYGEKFDMLNLQFILRSKRYYKMEPAAIYAQLIPVNYKLKKEEITALVEATSKEEGEQIFSRTWYGRKYQQLNLISMEELYNSLLRTVLEKEARKDPYSVAVLYSYLYHKEHEVNRLTIALECVRYQVDPDEAMHYVHNN